MRFFLTPGGEHGPPRTFGRRGLAGLAAFVLLAGMASATRANTVLVDFTGALGAGPGADFTWSYFADLAGVVGSSSDLLPGAPHPASLPATPGVTGDYFSINDIVGLDVADTLALATPAGWVTTVEALTFTYIPGFPIDSPALPNVRWTWTGPGVITSDAFLGVFSYVSALSTFAMTSYGGHDHKTSDGSLQSNYGLVEAAAPGPPVGFVPLPAAAAGGMALFGMVAVSRRRNAGQI